MTFALRFHLPLFAVGVLTTVCASGAVLADAAPTKVRQDLMSSVGFAAKQAGAMIKGEAPWDALKAELAMRTINAAATGFPHFFPEGSTSGNETEASPKIWEDMAGFLELAGELREHSAAGIAAAKKGPDDFNKEFTAMTKYCKDCHESFRIKKQ